jgi:hypothetical protein
VLLSLNKKISHFKNEEFEELFLQRKYTNGQQGHEKMLDIISSLENVILMTIKYEFVYIRIAII